MSFNLQLSKVLHVVIHCWSLILRIRLMKITHQLESIRIIDTDLGEEAMWNCQEEK